MRYCWYHANCFDGFGAAYAAWRALGTSETVFEPVWYERPPPELPAQLDELVLLDFTYSRPVLERLRDQVDRLVIIDHHATAQAELEGFECDVKIFDLDCSGAYLSFHHYNPDVPADDVPRLYRYLQDRDLWRFWLPKSREVNAYIKSFPYCFSTWSKIEAVMELNLEGCIREGEAVLRLQARTVEMICNEASIRELAGHRVPTVNSTAFWSEVGHELLERYPGSQMVAAYCDLSNGRRKYSLRSRDGFDCSAVARQFGGGGHTKAAGFSIEAPSREVER